MSEPVVYIGGSEDVRLFHGVQERATNWEGGIPSIKAIPLREALGRGLRPCHHKMCRAVFASLARGLKS